MPPPIIYFADASAFRVWLAAHHDRETELLVGYHKRATGRPSMTWAESVDEALCFGWIDGVRRRVDAERYSIRFTPRSGRSTWSEVNIARMGELRAAGRVTPAGEAAFARRTAARSGVYSYEARSQGLSPEHEAVLRADAAAWQYFSGEAPWYQRTAAHWVASAKREATRERRLATLIACSAAGERVPPLRR